MAPKRAADDEPETDPGSCSPSASDFCVEPVLNKRRKAAAGEEEDTKKKKGRLWSEEAEVAILQGMIDFKADQGADPWTNKIDFHCFLLGRLNADVTQRQVIDKVRRLKHKYYDYSDGADFARGHDIKLVELCKTIWGNTDRGDNGVGRSSRKSKAEDDRVPAVLALLAGKRKKSTLEKKEKKKKNNKAGVDVGNVDHFVEKDTDANVDDVGDMNVNVDDVVENGGGGNVGDVVEKNVDASDDKEKSFWSRYPFLRDSVELGKRGSMEDHFMRLLPLVGDSNANMLDAGWRELQLLETDLISKKLALYKKQNDLIRDTLKSTRGQRLA